jgi:DNA-binding beta-propeller fold protein YncE
MYLMPINQSLQRWILIVILSGIVLHIEAQDTLAFRNHEHHQTPSITWIGQFPPLEENKRNSNIASRFFDFLFGKRKPVLIRPFSVLAFHPDTLWVLDQGSKTIAFVEKEASKITQLTRKKSAGFPSLVGICATGDGEILFTDSQLNTIFFITRDRKSPRVLNDSLSLQRPTGVAYSRKTNEIWIVETNAHRISVLNRKGELMKRVGQRGTAPGEFNFPTFIWIDRAGMVYVVDSMNFRVQILNENGEIQSVFGESGDATGYFAMPKDIATDSQGHIYVVDALFHAVQVFDIQGNFLLNFGKQGRDKGEFWLPVGIYIDEADRIYVADSYNARIQVFQFTPETVNEN